MFVHSDCIAMACAPLLRITFSLLLTLSCAMQSATAQTLPAWFDASASTRTNAANAARDGAPPGVAAQVMIAAGDDAAHTVLAVVDAYNRCDAVFDSVRAAVTLAPDRAGDIVQAAASATRCPCSGETLWQRSRLERRIRIEQRRDPVLVAPLCGCAAAGAEAAVAVVPERADEVVEAALAAGRRASAVVDSLGRIGDDRGPAATSKGAIESALERALDGALVRVDARRCERDVVADDAFAPEPLWRAGTLSPDDLGVEPGCASDAGDRDQDGAGSDLALAGYVASSGDRVLVLRNTTRSPIDLAAGNYLLELSFPGVAPAGRRIALGGRVEPGAAFVVAGRGVAAAWRERADQIVAGGLLAPGDAVVLRRGLERDGCECSVASVAGAANGLGPAGADWLAQQAGIGAAAAPMQIADRIGQVRPETFARADWRSPIAATPLQLARVRGACDAPRSVDGPFMPGAPWQAADSGTYAAAVCASTPATLLLARIDAWAPPADGEAPARAVQVFNGTGVDVDLAAEGYVLELFADGAREPARVIPLSGKLVQGESFLVASNGVPATIQRDARALSDDLAQRALDAVVLRRIATGVGGICRADVYAAAAEVGAPPIVIAAAPEALPEGEPRTDESPIDPDRGGDVASPN